jgi:hypothetical protein
MLSSPVYFTLDTVLVAVVVFGTPDTVTTAVENSVGVTDTVSTFADAAKSAGAIVGRFPEPLPTLLPTRIAIKTVSIARITPATIHLAFSVVN